MITPYSRDIIVGEVPGESDTEYVTVGRCSVGDTTTLYFTDGHKEGSVILSPEKVQELIKLLS